MDFSKPHSKYEEHKLSEDIIKKIRDNEHFKQFQKELREIVKDKVVEGLNKIKLDKTEDDYEGNNFR